jgi:hypothetical protein
VEECKPFSDRLGAPGILAKGPWCAVEECKPFLTGGYIAPGTAPLPKHPRRAVEECKPFLLVLITVLIWTFVVW